MTLKITVFLYYVNNSLLMKLFSPSSSLSWIRDPCRSTTFDIMFGVKLIRWRCVHGREGGNMLLKIAICVWWHCLAIIFNMVYQLLPFMFLPFFLKCIQFSLNWTWGLVPLLALKCSLELLIVQEPVAEVETITKPFLPILGHTVIKWSQLCSQVVASGSRRGGCRAQVIPRRVIWDLSVAGGRATRWQEPGSLDGYLEESRAGSISAWGFYMSEKWAHVSCQPAFQLSLLWQAGCLPT